MTKETILMILDCVRVAAQAAATEIRSEIAPPEALNTHQLLLVNKPEPEKTPETVGTGRRDKLNGGTKNRRSRPSERPNHRGELEYLYTSDGYTRVAGDLHVGDRRTYRQGKSWRGFVWLTESERVLVKTEHSRRLHATKTRKDDAWKKPNF